MKILIFCQSLCINKAFVKRCSWFPDLSATLCNSCSPLGNDGVSTALEILYTPCQPHTCSQGASSIPGSDFVLISHTDICGEGVYFSSLVVLKHITCYVLKVCCKSPVHPLPHTLYANQSILLHCPDSRGPSLVPPCACTLSALVEMRTSVPIFSICLLYKLLQCRRRVQVCHVHAEYFGRFGCLLVEKG